jgi:SAM-dependent MidA family methyltransferase
MATILKNVGERDLTQHVDITSEDEIGTMSRKRKGARHQMRFLCGAFFRGMGLCPVRSGAFRVQIPEIPPAKP